MQHLLDFVHDHTVEEQLYFVVDTPGGELELMWQRAASPDHWQIRPRRNEGPSELVARKHLLADLSQRGVDMTGVERELQSLIATQIVFADIVLRDAQRLLGGDTVDNALQSYREFVMTLRTQIRQLAGPAQPAPGLDVLDGDALSTKPRSGHLTLVR